MSKHSTLVIGLTITGLLPTGGDPSRYFYKTTYEGRRYAVRNGYHLVSCYGEAHSNPHIDNCPVCMGHSWGVVAVPLAYGTLRDYRDRDSVDDAIDLATR